MENTGMYQEKPGILKNKWSRNVLTNNPKLTNLKAECCPWTTVSQKALEWLLSNSRCKKYSSGPSKRIFLELCVPKK